MCRVRISRREPGEHFAAIRALPVERRFVEQPVERVPPRQVQPGAEILDAGAGQHGGQSPYLGRDVAAHGDVVRNAVFL